MTLTAMNCAYTVWALSAKFGQPELFGTVDLRPLPSHLHSLKGGGSPPEDRSEASAQMCDRPHVDWLAVGILDLCCHQVSQVSFWKVP